MKTQNPFTGRSKGSLANVTASTYCGQNILKSKPLEVRNPRTDKQVNVRAILAQAAVLAKLMMTDAGIAKRSARTGRNIQKTARTALLSANLAKKTGVAPDIRLRGAGISLQGLGISQPGVIEAILDRAITELTVEWSPVVPTGGLSTDVCSIALVDLESGVIQSFPSVSTRQAAQVKLTVTNDTLLQSGALLTFVMFDSADGLRYDAVSSVLVSVS